MRYAIDGSNVLLGLQVFGKPSQQLFARLLYELIARQVEFQVFFDNSIVDRMKDKGVESEWHSLKATLAAANIATISCKRADNDLQKYCAENGAALINESDRLDSWRYRPTTVHRARNFGSKLALFDDSGLSSTSDRSPVLYRKLREENKIIWEAPALEGFEFGGASFPSLNTGRTMPFIAPDSQHATAATEGTLLVLALDASGSMMQNNTFDGRPKSDHLNDIVKAAITRFRNSRIGESLYLAILRFENDVTPLLGPMGAEFSSVNDWHEIIESFNYLSGVTPGATNIRLVLQRARELIQDTLECRDSVSNLADQWRAALVLITDGKHYVVRADGSREADTDVGSEAIKIHSGVDGLIDGRMDIGCVGIGKDVNTDFLTQIASRCSPVQMGMARRARIDHLFIERRLCIFVDSEHDKFGEAIRTFIDVASGRA